MTVNKSNIPSNLVLMVRPTKDGLILQGAGPVGKRHIKIFRPVRLKMSYRGIDHKKHKRTKRCAGLLATFKCHLP